MAHAARKLVVFCALCVGATEFISASSPLVLWSGRPTTEADGSVSFDWESTGCSFSVAGKGATVLLYSNSTLSLGYTGRISVYINNFDASNLLVVSGVPTYLIAAALSADVNNITVVYTLEPGSAGVTPKAFMNLFGFEAGNGGSFVPPPISPRRIDVIGDSITAGSSYDRMQSVGETFSLGGGCGPWTPVTGYSQAYNWESYVCRFFGANCTTVAWSGKGLIHNSGCSAGPTMPTLYSQAFATRPDVPWDFSRQSRPDAVLIYLGTNDYSCNETTDDAFSTALVSFMQNISALYAHSPGPALPTRFFCAVGLMSPTKPLNAVLNAIATANAAGLTATFLDLRNGTTDGCGGHPGPIGHFQLASEAAPQIQAAMGW